MYGRHKALKTFQVEARTQRTTRAKMARGSENGANDTAAGRTTTAGQSVAVPADTAEKQADVI